MKSRILRWGDDPRLPEWACDKKDPHQRRQKKTYHWRRRSHDYQYRWDDVYTSQEMLRLPERERQGGNSLLRYPGGNRI